MRRVNKIMMATVAILLCLVLITTSVVSGIFAKFVVEKSSSTTLTFKKWGITVTSGSDLAASYNNSDGKLMVEASTEGTKLIAPGTSGCIAYFNVEADSPEVDFKIDFEGTATIDDGYTAARKNIRDASDTPIDYFPIIFYLVAYDLNEDGTIKEVATQLNADGKKIDFTIGHRDKTTQQGVVSLDKNSQIYSFKTFENIAGWLNGVDDHGTDYKAGLSKVFDSAKISKDTSIKRVYAIQWCWPYNSESEYRNRNFDDTKPLYQTKEYDTQLGRAIRANKNDFDIKFDISVNIVQEQ